MAKCHNCGNEVAATAWNCLSCGSQFPTRFVTWSKIALVVMVVGFITLIVMLKG